MSNEKQLEETTIVGGFESEIVSDALTHDENLRLACLEIVLNHSDFSIGATTIVDRARRFESYVKEQDGR